MTPGLRKLALTAHITTTVGWLGAVVAYFALVAAALTSQDPQTVRAAFLAMELTYFALVPLAFASLLTGLVQSVGTTWGLLRHYWVLVKLALTVLATIVLLLNMQTVWFLARSAAETDSAVIGAAGRGQLIHAGGGLLVLLTATILAVYKPRGMTRYGRRKQDEQRRQLSS